jgi:2',3'-cyclic-nucleotide 2'-phosphodiesterase (5'-nucleotidase family)
MRLKMNSHKEITKKILLLFLGVLLIFGTFPIGTMAASQDSNSIETVINILHTNDIHGRIYEVDDNNTGMIGIDKIAEIKKNTENVILVDIGDALHGLPIVNINQGLNGVELMVAAGYSVMTPGNHDYNFDSARLSELAAIASSGGLDIISSNTVVKSTGQNLFPTTKIIEIDGIKVGFFGLTTMSTPTSTNPANVKTLEFKAYKESSENAIAELKNNGADIIIALAHIGRSEVKDLITALYVKPDVIIDGHLHILDSTTVDGVLIAQVGQYQENIGQISITINSNGEIVDKTETVITKADTADIAGDADVKALAEVMKQSVLERYSEIVARSDLFLSSERETNDGKTLGVRNSEQALGNLVADSMRINGNADLAVINGGGLRADIKPGDITTRDINSILPFGNVLIIKEVTPKALKEIMEHGLQLAPNASGRFPQISGMNILYDQAHSAGEKVISITINNTDLDLTDDTTIYKLATNDFMANGGDDYTAIQALRTIAEIGSLDDIFQQYIISLPNKTITAEVAKIEGRIEEYTPTTGASYQSNGVNALSAEA